MKGVELPINILVIVAIAVIVLLGMVLLYYTGFSPFSSSAGVEGTKNDACRVLVQEKSCLETTTKIVFDGSMLKKFDADKNNAQTSGVGMAWGTVGASCPGGWAGNDNLGALCACYYSRTSESQCKALCGCPGYSMT